MFLQKTESQSRLKIQTNAQFASTIKSVSSLWRNKSNYRYHRKKHKGVGKSLLIIKSKNSDFQIEIFNVLIKTIKNPIQNKNFK